MSEPGDGNGDKPSAPPPPVVDEAVGAEPMPEPPPDASLIDAFEATASVGSVDELYGHPPTTPPHEHFKQPPVDPSVVVASEVTRAGEADEQLLPIETTDLRAAVGDASPRSRAEARVARLGDDDSAPVKRNRKLFTAAALSMLAILIITTFALLGHVNAQRYVLRCTTDHAIAEHGRSFPPWGTEVIHGAQWKPIPLPLNAECKARETDNAAQLEGWYLDILLERASTTLNAQNLIEATPAAAGKPVANPLDTVSDQLSQALLLSRAPEHHDQRKEIERLQGDVQYWRASLRLREAHATLLDAAKQFDAAAQQRPRYVTDAAAWAGYIKKLADDLHAGPNGAPSVQSVLPTAASDHPSAPAGSELPVEPEPPAAAGSDAPPPPAVDAGVPTGGVLL